MATEYGERLKRARAYAGNISQTELSRRTGIPQSTIGSAEAKGHGSADTPKYAAACGVSAIWLATGEGSMVPESPIPPQYAPFVGEIDPSTVTAVPMGRARVQRSQPFSQETERRLASFLALLHHLPGDRRDAALAEATSALAAHLQPAPTDGQSPPAR